MLKKSEVLREGFEKGIRQAQAIISRMIFESDDYTPNASDVEELEGIVKRSIQNWENIDTPEELLDCVKGDIDDDVKAVRMLEDEGEKLKELANDWLDDGTLEKYFENPDYSQNTSDLPDFDPNSKKENENHLTNMLNQVIGDITREHSQEGNPVESEDDLYEEAKDVIERKTSEGVYTKVEGAALRNLLRDWKNEGKLEDDVKPSEEFRTVHIYTLERLVREVLDNNYETNDDEEEVYEWVEELLQREFRNGQIDSDVLSRLQEMNKEWLEQGEIRKMMQDSTYSPSGLGEKPDDTLNSDLDDMVRNYNERHGK